MAIITQEEMEKYITDPTAIQWHMLNFLSSATEDDIKISDPTNPFVMLLEAAATTASAAATEAINVHRKKYPSLSLNEEDIWHHLSSDELTNMFAIPAEANFLFYVNIKDLRSSGREVYNEVNPNKWDYIETTIPVGTTVTISSTVFTLLNAINVRLYNNGSVYVEQRLNNDIDIAFNNVGVLASAIQTDSSGINWIVFEARLKQVNRITATKPIIAAEGFNVGVLMKSKFCYADVFYANSNTNNQYIAIPKTYTDEYLNPSSPTCCLSVADNTLRVKIPDVYLMGSSNSVSGTALIHVYETDGKINIPAHKYPVSEFQIVIGQAGVDVAAATAANIVIMCRSQEPITGGADNMTYTKLRENVINNTTGDIDLPVTEKQLIRSSEMAGYSVYKQTDTLDSRSYLALRSLSEFESNILYARMDIFNVSTTINLNSLLKEDGTPINPKFINCKDEAFIIKAGTIFKYDNGIVSIISGTDDGVIQTGELGTLSKLNDLQLVEHLKTNKYYVTPYYYTLNTSTRYITTTVYELDRPTITNHAILEKNTNLSLSCNVTGRGIERDSTGYVIGVKLAGDNGFEAIWKRNLKVVMKLPLYEGGQSAYIEAEYDEIKDIFRIYIDSTMYIQDDKRLDVINGYSPLPVSRFNIETKAYIYILTSDPSIIDPVPDNSIWAEIREFNNAMYPNEQLVYITKESLDITFGRELDTLYRNTYTIYTERKYKRHEHDVLARYEEDVFDIDSESGAGIGTDELDNFTYRIKHHQGDIVYSDKRVVNENGVEQVDEYGEPLYEPVYKYRKGDVVLDDFGNPIIDKIAGLEYHIDILMYEYEFTRTNTIEYHKYKNFVMDDLFKCAVTDLRKVKENLLDNTSIYYRPNRTVENIITVVNGNDSHIPYLITPKIKLYIKSDKVLDDDDLDALKNTIGQITNKHINMSRLVMNDLKHEIIRSLPVDISGVKISNIDKEDSEIIVFKDETKKPTINKFLKVNNNNLLVVVYGVDLEVEYVG